MFQRASATGGSRMESGAEGGVAEGEVAEGEVAPGEIPEIELIIR